MNSDIDFESLRDKLEHIAAIESDEEFVFYGVRFTLRSEAEASSLTSEAVVDDVRDFLTTVKAEADSWGK